MLQHVDKKEFDDALIGRKLQGTDCIHCLGGWDANIPSTFLEPEKEGMIWWHNQGLCQRREGRLSPRIQIKRAKWFTKDDILSL